MDRVNTTYFERKNQSNTEDIPEVLNVIILNWLETCETLTIAHFVTSIATGVILIRHSQLKERMFKGQNFKGWSQKQTEEWSVLEKTRLSNNEALRAVGKEECKPSLQTGDWNRITLPAWKPNFNYILNTQTFEWRRGVKCSFYLFLSPFLAFQMSQHFLLFQVDPAHQVQPLCHPRCALERWISDTGRAGVGIFNLQKRRGKGRYK